MDEKTFWIALERRLCDEFAGMPERRLRYWWCDDLVAESYQLDDPEPRIVGRAWICNGQKQEIWKFTLFLDKPVALRENIDWQHLLPAHDLTCWIALDETQKRIQIESSVAVPDFPVPH